MSSTKSLCFDVNYCFYSHSSSTFELQSKDFSCIVQEPMDLCKHHQQVASIAFFMTLDDQIKTCTITLQLKFAPKRRAYPRGQSMYMPSGFQNIRVASYQDLSILHFTIHMIVNILVQRIQ